MSVDLSKVEKFLIQEKAFTVSTKGFYIYNYDEEKVLYADYPSFTMMKTLNFYDDETKANKVFSVKQDKVMNIVNATFSLTDGNGKVIAKFKANLSENLVKRNIQILNAGDEPICNLVEEGALGNVFGKMGGSAAFAYKKDGEVLGKFVSGVKKKMGLLIDAGPDLDAMTALAAAIILYARLV